MEGKSKVYIDSHGNMEREEERTYKHSYYRVIDIANDYILVGYKINSFGGSRICLSRDNSIITVGLI